tara:strand:- start:986 stop:1225 length:240 start_codon:yes stop_codon:yes gene_type:complete
MELSMMIIWNAIVTLIIAPILYGIRSNTAEIKRIDILTNKTREEIAANYVTKAEMERDFDRLLDRFDRLEEKIDKIINS